MTKRNPNTQRGGNPRPPTPSSKGIEKPMPVWTDFPTEDGLNLRQRAAYETMKWRAEHDGKGRAITVQDIVRRVVAEYFRRVPALPPGDPIAALIRSMK